MTEQKVTKCWLPRIVLAAQDTWMMLRHTWIVSDDPTCVCVCVSVESCPVKSSILIFMRSRASQSGENRTQSFSKAISQKLI